MCSVLLLRVFLSARGELHVRSPVPFAIRGKSAQGGSISVRVTTMEAALEVRRRMKELGATQIRIFHRRKQPNTVSPSGSMLPEFDADELK